MRSSRRAVAVLLMLLGAAEVRDGVQAAESPAAAASPAHGALELRSFAIVHRPIDEAYRLISPLLSEQAELRVLRGARRIEVRDASERLAAVAQALAGFDVAPRRVRIQVRLVKGEKSERLAGGAARPDRLDAAESERLVPRDVRDLVSFDAFETLGSLEIDAREGMPTAAMVGPEERYRIEIAVGAVDRASGAIPLDSLALARRAQGSDGRTVYRPVLEFKEVLQNGRVRVLFATASPTDRRALFLVLTGTIE